MKNNEHPSGDERYKAIDRKMKRAGYQKDALLEVLNTAQAAFGYLSEDLLVYISQQLKIPLSRVYGVATFYHLFTFSPLGEHNCIVCTGTACHVKGADQIVLAVSRAFDISPGETTPDGLLSLTTARCLGSCGLAPMIVFNGDVSGKQTPESALNLVKETISSAKDEVQLAPEVG